MPNFTAVYDACVLYPAPLRDLLMNAAVTEIYFVLVGPIPFMMNGQEIYY